MATIARLATEIIAKVEGFDRAVSSIERVDRSLTNLSRSSTKMDAMIAGMSKIGKVAYENAQASQRMIDGMSAVGKAVEKPTTALQGLTGTIKSLGGVMVATFAVDKVIGFAKEIVTFASDLNDLSAKTGISVERLQAFNLVGNDVGVTVDQIKTGIAQMADKLVGGDTAAVNALARLNLNAEELIKMRPDEAFLRIAENVAKIPNSNERIAVMQDIFGRMGTELLPLVNTQLSQMVKEAERLSIPQETIDRADQFGETIERLWIRFKALTVVAADFIGQHLQIMPIEMLKMVGSLKTFISEGNATEDVMNKITARGKAFATEGLKPVAIHGKEVNEVITKMNGEIRAKMTKNLEDAKDAAEKAAKPMKDLADSVARANSDFHNTEGMKMFNADLAVLNATSSEATRNLQKLAMQATLVQTALSSSNINPALLMGGPGAMPYGGNLYTYGSGVPLLGAGEGFSLKDFFKGGLGPTVMGALMGGGNVGGSMGGFVGGGLMGKFLSTGLGKSLGGMFGGALGSFLPGIGNLVGSFIGKGLGSLFGSLTGAEGKKTNDLRDQMFMDLGGFDKVAKLAAEAGFSMDRLLKPSKVKDFQRAWEDFNTTLEKHKEHLNNINALIDAQHQRQQMLQDAVARYGFTLEELPEQMRNQEMARNAEQLLTDFKLLTEAGFNIDTVIGRMGESINEFVRQAMKTGTEVPNQMRPMIEKMIEQGLLTDEAGNKLTDMANIKFGETLTEQFENVLQKLDELIEKLNQAISLGGSLPSVPNTTGYVEGDQSYPDTYPMAAGGAGMVTRPTLFLAGEGGPEQFAFSGANRSFGGGDSSRVVKAIEMLRTELRVDREVSRLMVRSEALKALA